MIAVLWILGVLTLGTYLYLAWRDIARHDIADEWDQIEAATVAIRRDCEDAHWAAWEREVSA